MAFPLTLVDNATAPTGPSFPFDIFTRLFEGDWIAWTCLIMFIVGVGLVSFLIILWWKLPQFAKAGFINTIIGHRPVVLECYENKKVKFQIPQMFRNGLAYLKGAWYIPPKLWASASEDLKDAERQAVNAVYNGDGCPAGLYLNYSIQSQVVNPELVVVVQHEREIKRLSEKEPILIDKELFIAALRHIKDKCIQLQPMNLSLPLDIRGLKTMLPQSLSKSQLSEQENQIRNDERQKNAFGGNKSTLMTVVLIILLIINVVSVLHDFKVF